MLNRAVVIGRLTKDPELRYTASGIAVTQFTAAVDRPFGGEEKETDFIPIVTWRQLAEVCAEHLQKGRLVAVEGRIQVRHYENDEGKRIYMTEIVADNVRFLDSRKEEEEEVKTPPARNTNNRNNGSSSSSSSGNRSSGNRSGNRNSSSTRNKTKSYNDNRPIDINEDDLPF